MRQVFDSTGATVEAGYSYDAYGVMLGANPTSATRDNPVGTSLLHAGEQFDTDLQMYYLRARWM